MKNKFKSILTSIDNDISLIAKKKESIKLLIVTKSQDVRDIQILIDSGYHIFGENYLQEAINKIQILSKTQTEWHFIGKIQSNKISDIVKYFDFIQTLSNLKHATLIDKECEKQNKMIDVCVQVNIDNEETKAGLSTDRLDEFLDELPRFGNLKIRGLMAIPSRENINKEKFKSYEKMQNIFNKYSVKYDNFDTLSIGMSNDYKTALKYGANLIRIGSLIFGERS